jgi:nucleoside-diphosphate-sugar epimerase
MILLTGCTGFLGSRLLERFLREGEEVVATKRSFSNLSRLAAVAGHPRLKLVDLDRSEPERLFEHGPVDTIVHAATQYGRTATPLYSILEANLILPLRLAELGIRHGTRCFINTDSYFNKANHSYSNLLDYALSKKSLLTWLDKLSGRLRIINAVLEHIYGPHDSESKFVEGLIRQIAIRKVDRFPMTHGHQKRDFVYLGDVVDAYWLLISHGRTHDFHYKSFEIGTGTGTPVRDFALSVKRQSGSHTTLGFGDIEYRGDEIMNSTAETSPLRELGWRPSTSVEEGIAEVLAAYSAHV